MVQTWWCAPVAWSAPADERKALVRRRIDAKQRDDPGHAENRLDVLVRLAAARVLHGCRGHGHLSAARGQIGEGVAARRLAGGGLVPERGAGGRCRAIRTPRIGGGNMIVRRNLLGRQRYAFYAAALADGIGRQARAGSLVDGDAAGHVRQIEGFLAVAAIDRKSVV